MARSQYEPGHGPPVSQDCFGCVPWSDDVGEVGCCTIRAVEKPQNSDELICCPEHVSVGWLSSAQNPGSVN